MCLSPSALHFRSAVSWFPHRKDKNVLWLHYEDMKEDLTYCVRLIAKFLDIGADNPKLLKLVEQQVTHSFDVSSPFTLDLCDRLPSTS